MQKSGATPGRIVAREERSPLEEIRGREGEVAGLFWGRMLGKGFISSPGNEQNLF